MMMNRYMPRRLLDEMQPRFDLLNGITSRPRRELASAYPALNAWSDAHNYYVEAEIPGIALEDVEIFVSEGKVLTITGKRGDGGHDHGKWLARERGFGAFERQIDLPDPVDEQRVEASLRNGVLTIKLPKAPEILPRRIEVKSG